MATGQSLKRLQKEYADMLKFPTPNVVAAPEDSNILTWYYIVDGPADTPYAGGEYMGRIHFPANYPFAPPSILMCTPSGRFQTEMRICLSMSCYHPENWSPIWNCAKILQGLVSFMADVEPAAGTIESSTSTKVALAKASREWNMAHPKYAQLFPQRMEAAVAAKRAQEEKVAK